MELTIHLREPHARQREFLESTAKRIVIRAGRRGGKTTGIAIRIVERFLAGRRQLYAAPTEDQVETLWWEIKQALREPLDAGVLYKNETKHIIEVPGTKQRIRAKTAWNADTLRGDYADDLILDEFQLMAEDAWGVVGAPMLADNNGDAVFIYTPVSLRSSGVSKAKDKRHAAKMFKRAQQDSSGRWAAITFPSWENPYVSAEALSELAQDMTEMAYRQEIGAEDVDEVPGALWKRDMIRRVEELPDLVRIVVGVDPSGGAVETGIVTAGIDAQGFGYILSDTSLLGSPATWGNMVVASYDEWKADRVCGERNYGGDMVESTIRSVTNASGQTRTDVSYKDVIATRGKAVRAEPVSAKYEKRQVFHYGTFPELEEEMCTWVPDSGMKSPNRMDAMVWAITELMLKTQQRTDFGSYQG